MIGGKAMKKICIIIFSILLISTCYLSETYAQRLVNDRLSLIDLKTKYNSCSVDGGPAGTFTIAATFKNISTDDLARLIFLVEKITVGNQLLNADGGPGGFGSYLTAPLSDGLLSPGESFTLDFIIGLSSRNRFEFFVDVLGGAIDVFLPTINPGAITAGVSTTVTISAMISSSTLIPSSVNIVEVDESGCKIGILGVLNDAGINGDILPGDKIFGGEIPFSESSTGIIKLQVAATFPGISGKLRSESSGLEVFQAGTPTSLSASNTANAASDPETGEDIVLDEIIVFFEPGTDVNIIDQVVDKVNGDIIGLLPWSKGNAWQVLIPCTSVECVRNAVQIMDNDPSTQGAEPSFVANVTQVTPSDPRFRSNQQWGLAKIEAERAWTITTGSNTQIIGVVDTGVDYNHEDLLGKVLLGRDEVNDDNDPIDDNDHGTHVAGIAAANSNNSIGISGTSWDNSILAVKVFNAFGHASRLQVAKGIRNAVDRNAAIINLSFGSSSRSETEAKAIDYANKAGRLIVAAAGNNNCPKKSYPGGYNDTEVFSDKSYNTRVLGVGATDQNDNHAIWKSNQPQCTPNSGSNFGPWVDITAPGTEILSTIRNNGYDNFNGTSMATPFVSGVAALVWSQNANLTAAQIHDTLIETADRTGNRHPDGREIIRLNAFNAVSRFATRSFTIPAIDAGWYSEVGTHGANTENYFVGTNFAGGHRNFFVFDLQTLPSVNLSESDIGVILEVFNPANGFASPQNSERYDLYDVTTAIDVLRRSHPAGEKDPSIYEDLGTGRSYGTYTATVSDNNRFVRINLSRLVVIADMFTPMPKPFFAIGGAIGTIDGIQGDERLFGSSHLTEPGNPNSLARLIITITPIP